MSVSDTMITNFFAKVETDADGSNPLHHSHFLLFQFLIPILFEIAPSQLVLSDACGIRLINLLDCRAAELASVGLIPASDARGEGGGCCPFTNGRIYATS